MLVLPPMGVRRTIRAADVGAMQILLTEDGCAYRRHIDEAFSRIGRRLRVHQEIGSVGAILACVRAGMGVGIVPARAVPAHDSSLVTRQVADLPLSIPVGLLSRRGTGGSAVLVSTVRDHLERGLRPGGNRARDSRLP